MMQDNFYKFLRSYQNFTISTLQQHLTILVQDTSIDMLPLRMFFQQLITNTHSKTRIISWINKTMNNNKDYYFNAQSVEKLSTQKFNRENRLMGKLIFHSLLVYAWEKPLVTTLVIKKAKGCLALSLMLPWVPTSASTFR